MYREDMRRYLSIPAAAFVVALVGITFLAASSHCSLNVLASQTQAPHGCCHEEDGSGQPRNLLECCTSLPAPLPAVSSAPVVQLVELQPLWDDASALLAPPAPVEVGLGASAAGPPEIQTFAESVLNRSLLAHAPPFFVV